MEHIMERAIAIMLLCLICIAGGGELVIVEAGRSDYEIVIRNDASYNTRLSAKELQEQVAKTSGVTLPIVNKAAPGKKSIYVGAHESLPSTAEFDPKEYEGKERFRIAELQKGSISIMGAETNNDAYSMDELGGDYGLLFGVYEFVERFLGTRWYAPGTFGECIEHKDRIVVNGLPIDQMPACKGRSFWPRIWVEFTPQDSIRFCRKTRGWGMGTGVGNHSMLDMPNRFPDKPEIFALDADGKTRRMGTLKPDYPDQKSGLRYVSYPQMCLTNPETIDAYCQFVDDVYEGRPEGKLWYSNPPGPKSINVVVNDDFSILPCHCPNCQALIQPKKGSQGAKSNLVWQFVDKTARRLGKKYPDKVIAALAYQDYYLPPDFKVADNVVVGICVNPYIIFHGAEKHYRRVDNVMKAWSEKCKEISLWHYLTPYDSYPYAMPHIMYKWHHAYPAVKNVFFELNDTLLQRSNLTPLPVNKNRRCGSDMGQLHLDLYFGMKGLWGTDLNVDEELNRYYRLFYGPAEKPMKEFFTLIIQRWENVKSDKVTVNEASRDARFSGEVMYESIYSPQVTKKMQELIAAALKLAPEGSLYRKRVQWLLDSHLNKFFEMADVYARGNRLPAEITVKAVAKGPQMDGSLNEPFYKDLPEYGFQQRLNTLPPRFDSKIKIGATGKMLHIGLVCEDPDHDSRRTQHNQNDNINLFQDDSIEIFIVPNPDKPGDFFNVTLGLNEAITDYQVKSRIAGMDLKYQSGTVCKVALKDNCFVMEVAIPFENTGIHLDSEKGFRLNVCRTKSSGVREARELSCWKCTYGSFWNLADVPILKIKSK